MDMGYDYQGTPKIGIELFGFLSFFKQNQITDKSSSLPFAYAAPDVQTIFVRFPSPTVRRTYSTLEMQSGTSFVERVC